MRTLHALPVLALCVMLPFAVVLPASAATPPRGSQTADPVPPQPQPDAAISRKVYLPTVARGPAARVSAIELTQATQNATQTVPMVAGRPTVARVFLQSSVGISGQSVTLSATRNGVALAGSPLTRTAATSYVAPNRDVASQSTNFLLPTAWLSGNLVLTARVVAGGQSLARTVTFQPVPPLRVTIVPIRYVHAPTGKSYAAPTTAAFPASVQRMFPIPNLEIRWHAPITFLGNLTASASNRLADWDRLLNIVLALKQSEGVARDMVYMALVPTSISSDNKIYYTGIGTSMRATVNFDMALTPAHELGHTLGRGHAPCGGVTNADPAYPYAGALIGAQGFNTASSALIDPAVTTDLMSYCAEWISDYNYIGMYTNQRAAVSSADVAAASANVDGVLVRARLNPGEPAEILPLYALRAPLTDNQPIEGSSSVYSVTFVDEAGVTLATHAVAAAAAEEEGLSIQVLSAILPLPAGQIAAVEVRDGSNVLATRAVNAAAGAAQAPAVLAESGALNLTFADAAPKLLRLVQGDRITTLAVDMAEMQLALPMDHLPGGDGAVEAISADVLPQPGAASAAAASAIALPNMPPVATIAPPEMPLGGGGIVIVGYADDSEDGMLEPEWFVNGELVARGPFLQIEELATLQSPTEIALRATDSAGQVATTTLTLQPVQFEAAQAP